MNRLAYVAFLRGINVGGNTIIKMTDLKKAFESLGFTHVTTLLASGNVVFESANSPLLVLKQKIEKELENRFRVQVLTILRTGSQILDLIKSDPFKNAHINPHTKLHVTFLAEETKRGAKFPSQLPSQEFQIVQVSPSEVCSVVEPAPKAGTPELMTLLQKEFGKNITTRTWNTIQKIGNVVGG
jgi:uncharacterized protein (DUF1697 family)